MDNAGPAGAIFLMLVVSFTEAKSYEGVYSFSGQWATRFSKTKQHLQQNTLSGPREGLKPGSIWRG